MTTKYYFSYCWVPVSVHFFSYILLLSILRTIAKFSTDDHKTFNYCCLTDVHLRSLFIIPYHNLYIFIIPLWRWIILYIWWSIWVFLKELFVYSLRVSAIPKAQCTPVSEGWKYTWTHTLQLVGDKPLKWQRFFNTSCSISEEP